MERDCVAEVPKVARGTSGRDFHEAMAMGGSEIIVHIPCTLSAAQRQCLTMEGLEDRQPCLICLMTNQIGMGRDKNACFSGVTYPSRE